MILYQFQNLNHITTTNTTTNMKKKFDIDKKLSILIGLWILDKVIILAMLYWFDS